MNVIKKLNQNKVFVINIIVMAYIIFSLIYPYAFGHVVKILENGSNLLLPIIFIINLFFFEYYFFNLMHLIYIYPIELYFFINYANGPFAETLINKFKFYNLLILIFFFILLFRFLKSKKNPNIKYKSKVNFKKFFLFLFISLFTFFSSFFFREIIIRKRINEKIKNIKYMDHKNDLLDWVGVPDEIIVLKNIIYDKKLKRKIKESWYYKDSLFFHSEIIIKFNDQDEIVNIKRVQRSIKKELKNLFDY